MTSDTRAPAPETAESAQPLSRLTSLDGLRGLAALVVVFHHLALTFAPISDTYEVSPPVHPAVGSIWWWFTSTPLQLVIAGPDAVLIFFVLSGLVVALPVIKRPNFDWFAYYPQRIVRLYLPAVVSVALAALLLLVTVGAINHFATTWAAASRPAVNGDLFTMAFGATDLLFGDVSINNPLWTLRWEVAFSLLLPVFVLLALATRRWWVVAIVASLGLIWAGFITGNSSMTYLLIFLIGSIFASRLNSIRDWVQHHSGTRWFTWAAAAFLVLCLLLLDLHWTVWGALGGNHPAIRDAAMTFEVVGAAGIVLVAALWRPAVRLLNTRVFRWLGRVSFSLYLVHVPVIIACDALFGTKLTIVRVVVSLAVALVLAEVFARFVEAPAHRFAKRVGRRSGEFMARRSAVSE